MLDPLGSEAREQRVGEEVGDRTHLQAVILGQKAAGLVHG